MNADVVMTPGVIHVVYEDDNTGTVKYLKGTYVLPSSVNTMVREAIEIYPNPVTDEFIVPHQGVEWSDQCYLIDVAGRSMPLVAKVGNGKATFSVKGMAKGGYFFVMNSVGKQYYSKLILQ